MYLPSTTLATAFLAATSSAAPLATPAPTTLGFGQNAIIRALPYLDTKPPLWMAKRAPEGDQEDVNNPMFQESTYSSLWPRQNKFDWTASLDLASTSSPASSTGVVSAESDSSPVPLASSLISAPPSSSTSAVISARSMILTAYGPWPPNDLGVIETPTSTSSPYPTHLIPSDCKDLSFVVGGSKCVPWQEQECLAPEVCDVDKEAIENEATETSEATEMNEATEQNENTENKEEMEKRRVPFFDDFYDAIHPPCIPGLHCEDWDKYDDDGWECGTPGARC